MEWKWNEFPLGPGSPPSHHIKSGPFQSFAEPLQQDSSNQSEVQIELTPGHCSRYPLLQKLIRSLQSSSSVAKILLYQKFKEFACLTMGGSQSQQQQIIREVESDESLQARMRGTLESQLKGLKEDVLNVVPVITDNILATMFETSDAIVLRYSQLENKDTIARNIREIVGSDSIPNVTEFLVETASKMVAAMQSTEEMKEAMRWQRCTKVVKVKGQVVGMEAHYRVNLLDQRTKHYIAKDSKDTIVMISYKILVHTIKGNPKHLLSSDQLKEIVF